MVERVARAICGEPRGCDYPQCRCSPSWIVGIDHRARAAIAAMREPIEVMQRAWEGPEPWDQEALEVWQAMIDAALKE